MPKNHKSYTKINKFFTKTSTNYSSLALAFVITRNNSLQASSKPSVAQKKRTITRNQVQAAFNSPLRRKQTVAGEKPGQQKQQTWYTSIINFETDISN
ncbi:hypothetical protein TSAR_002422 [Trichomalopsis sarcophagae]|uniref:Uncharacterized protein n=1 Tax=Trichomalopsis sarcophagae TaxID=543379 RepID=A0A232EXA3_9HYME|nr:hypothetical protein TSAR_002422 [Trichomalopsis sarcophagae]